MTRIHYLQHVPFETLGLIASLIPKYSCIATGTRFWESADLPDPDSFDVLIVMGGPMNIYDTTTHPWLAAEKEFISRCIAIGKKVLGICLGSQLLADALGATVVKNRCKEIGWYPVVLKSTVLSTPLFKNIPAAITPFHWHGDTYPPPPGALLLGSSDACDNQGFIFDNRVIALQFHLEMTNESLETIISACGKDLISDEYVQTAREIRYYASNKLTLAQQVMEQLFCSLITV